MNLIYDIFLATMLVGGFIVAVSLLYALGLRLQMRSQRRRSQRHEADAAFGDLPPRLRRRAYEELARRRDDLRAHDEAVLSAEAARLKSEDIPLPELWTELNRIESELANRRRSRLEATRAAIARRLDENG